MSVVLVDAEAPHYPHCDPRVLHAPGECEFCDLHPVAQTNRTTAGVNFTGHSDPLKLLCPADVARGFKRAHDWPGNRPHKRRPTSGFWAFLLHGRVCPRCEEYRTGSWGRDYVCDVCEFVEWYDYVKERR